MDGDNFGNGDSSMFEKCEEIGRGAYGVVYKGINKITNEVIAIKKIKTELESEGVPSTALREISILRELEHPNIVQLKDVVCAENKLYLLFEYLDIDLRKYLECLNENEMLDPEIIKSFLFQILEAIAYCHSKKIIHRDVKPQNLLLDQYGKIKLADFGLARAFSIPVRPYTKEVLTLWYRAPEILLGSVEYSTPVDIWSLGCIFAELYLKKPLFQGEYEMDQLMKIFRILGTPSVNIWPDIQNLTHYRDTFPTWESANPETIFPNMDVNGIHLMTRMLCYDPSKRITAKQALLHPYFKKVKKFNADFP